MRRWFAVIGLALAVQCAILIVIGLTTSGWWVLTVVGLVILCTDAITMLCVRTWL